MENLNGQKRVKTSVIVPEDLRNRFKVACWRRGVTMSDIVQKFMDDWLKQVEPEEKRHA